jgi:hypothetical protein
MYEQVGGIDRDSAAVASVDESAFLPSHDARGRRLRKLFLGVPSNCPLSSLRSMHVEKVKLRPDTGIMR